MCCVIPEGAIHGSLSVREAPGRGQAPETPRERRRVPGSHAGGAGDALRGVSRNNTLAPRFSCYLMVRDDPTLPAQSNLRRAFCAKSYGSQAPSKVAAVHSRQLSADRRPCPARSSNFSHPEQSEAGFSRLRQNPYDPGQLAKFIVDSAAGSEDSARQPSVEKPTSPAIEFA